LSRARSSNISPTRRDASAARRRGSEWRSASGCSGRWAVSGSQANHFRIYASEKIPYAIDRYTDEVNRLFGVMNRRLADHEYLAGLYSIADMACVGWTRGWKRYGQEITDFPHLARWLDALLARPAVQRGLALNIPGRQQRDLSKDEEARKILFGQRTR
jgi:GST-like protein